MITVNDISVHFGGTTLFSDVSFAINENDKIALMGKNGAGKSTLLKIILNELQVDEGKVQTGDTVVFGYYSQGGIQLNNDKRILEVVKDIAEFIPLANGTSLSASALLTRFNFPPEVQHSFVSKLSGGEKRRLYLLTVLVKNPNFLILDEPTNDLDIVTLQTLEEFLDEFKGCVLIVSHDRYFMDRLVDHVFAFEGDGEIKDYPGTYSDYREWQQEQKLIDKKNNAMLSATEGDNTSTTLSITKPENTIEEKPQVVSVDSPKKLSFKLQHELKELESELPVLEEKKKKLEIELASGITDYEHIQKISDELKVLTLTLDEKNLRWLEIQEL